MLEIAEKYTRAAMTTQERMVWTLLSVSMCLLCVYSVNLDCQEMAACTDQLRAMNETVSSRVGTSQMINTCIQLTKTLPACYDTARKACDLSWSDTIPYQSLYYKIKESCSSVCPVFKPLLDCEKNVAYEDLGSRKTSYCRSYVESIECLESSLINITCSFGDETRAIILDTVYDQESRQFGDGVCMAAKDCADIDQTVTTVTSCLKTWNVTRDYTESGTDILKECISKKTPCSGALQVVPFYEKSLTGIGVTVPLTTESAETTTIVTTQKMMTSSVRSPAPSIDPSVKASYVTQWDVMEITTDTDTRPLNRTTEIVTKSLNSTAEIVTKSPTPMAEIVTKSLNSTAEIVTKSLNSTAEIVTKSPTPMAEIVTKSLNSTAEIVTKSPTPMAEIVTKSPTPMAEIVTKSPTPMAEIVTQPQLNLTDRTKDISIPTTSRSIQVTQPFNNRTNNTLLDSGLSTAIDATVSTVNKRKGIKTNPLANTDVVISNDSTNSSRKFSIGVTKVSSTTGSNEDAVVMVTSSNKVVEPEKVTTVSSPRQPPSTKELHGTPTPASKEFTSRLVNTDPSPVTTSPGFVDKHTIPLRHTTSRVSMVDAEDPTPNQGTTPNLITNPAAEPTTIGRETTRTLISSVHTSSSTTETVTEKLTPPSTSSTSDSSLKKEPKIDGTNGGSTVLQPKATLLCFIVTLSPFFLT